MLGTGDVPICIWYPACRVAGPAIGAGYPQTHQEMIEEGKPLLTPCVPQEAIRRTMTLAGWNCKCYKYCYFMESASKNIAQKWDHEFPSNFPNNFPNKQARCLPPTHIGSYRDLIAWSPGNQLGLALNHAHSSSSAFIVVRTKVACHSDCYSWIISIITRINYGQSLSIITTSDQ